MSTHCKPRCVPAYAKVADVILEHDPKVMLHSKEEHLAAVQFQQNRAQLTIASIYTDLLRNFRCRGITLGMPTQLWLR